MCTTPYVPSYVSKTFHNNKPTVDTWQMLILDEVDRMSKDAQHSLRRTMEKYTAACRIVLCCNNVSKVWGWNGVVTFRLPVLCWRTRSLPRLWHSLTSNLLYLHTHTNISSLR